MPMTTTVPTSRLAAALCPLSDAGLMGVGKRPQLVRRFVKWLHRLLGAAPIISTIRTAFSLEAFKKQLQKQTVAVVATALVAEKRQNQEKKKHTMRQRPP